MHIGTGLFIPVATGLIGWYFARRLRFPAAGVLGPMMFVGGGTCLGVLEVAFPDWIKVVLQIAIGSYAGTSVSRQTISDIKATGRSVAVVTGWTLSSAMLIGYLASLVTHVDLSTALLGSAPGGVAEMSVMALAGFLQKGLGTDACTALLACAPAGMTQMPIIADELGADLPRVTVFQLARFLCSVMVLPIVFRVLL